ncbi:terminase large subunit [Pseudoalteromonas phage H101]|uniref:Terminase large subunit n=1 Tax=Pseudoalteromonas phage H101 TaxID=1654919 RepID=A0A0H4IP49_9CAUD|nr:terminase large subunit [Pseudoalteromonas phage H101]AKO61122.1 terminase large subunit [Pseudoalteromonas phage H101]
MSYTKREDIKPQKGKQSLVMKMIRDQEVDFMLCGGARAGGKSELLSMMPLLFAHDKQYRGIFFRKSFQEIMGANGLWQKAQNMYGFFDAKPNKSSKTWQFPSGAIQEYGHLYNEGDEESHRGKGYSLVGFDEIDQFSPDAVRLLMTCLRSEADMSSFMVGTLNPNPDSWCLPLVEWYLNSDGSPNEERCGVVRNYIVKDGEFVFGPDEQFFKDNYPEAVYVQMPNSDEVTYVRPKRFTYVFFNVFDNPAFCSMNPTYLTELNNLPDHERATQLFGNWYAREKGDSYFVREFLKEVDRVPSNAVTVRAWDKAYSDNIKASPDFTASICMSKCPAGNYFISANFDEELHDTFKEGEDVVYGRFRKKVGERDQWMLQQAHYDGEEVTVVIPAESGAGKGEEEQLKKMFINEGFLVKTVKVGNSEGNKLKKFLVFCSAAENGLVHIVKDSFPNYATYNAYLKELEQFTGKRSSRTMKDDWVDVTSDCYETLRRDNTFRAIPLPTFSNDTKLSQYRKSLR